MHIERLLAGLGRRHVQIDIHTIHYDDSMVNKPVVLLLHGLSANRSVWHRFCIENRGKYRFISIDLPGHGESTYIADYKYTAENYADICIQLMRKLNIHSYHIVGNSLGGKVAALIKHHAPDSCKKIVLVDPAGADTDLTRLMQEQRFNPFLHSSVDSVLEMYDLVMQTPPFIPKSVLLHVAHSDYLSQSKRIVHLCNDLLHTDKLLEERLDIAPSQVQLLWGEEDQFIPVTDAQTWQGITGGQLTVYRGIGHMPMIECSKVAAKDIHRFLSA